ncbi:MAG: tandem-95 repeat protein [Rhizobiaceae bacterium]
MTLEDQRFSIGDSDRSSGAPMAETSENSHRPLLVAQDDVDPVPMEILEPERQDAGASAFPAEIVADDSNVIRLPARATIEDIRVDGANLILVQADGSEIVILHAALRIPTFIVGDVEIPQEALLAVLDASGINVAAEPDGSFSAVGGGPPSSGANFDSLPPRMLQSFDVLDLLGNTELGNEINHDDELYGEGNNAPAIVSATLTGEVLESDDVPGGVDPDPIPLSGTIGFSDADLGDTFTADVTSRHVAGTALDHGLVLSDQQIGDLLAGFALSAVSSPSAVANGSVQWHYTIGNAAVDFLSVGETVTLNFAVTISDGIASVTTTVTIVVTGTNDAPEIEAIAQTDLVEAPSPLTALISVSFVDVDLSDIGHTATVTGALASGDTLGLVRGEVDEAGLIALITPGPGTSAGPVTKPAGSSDGSVDLTFSADPSVFDYLAIGEVVTLTYTLTIDDGDGGVGQQTFVVTIAGTNDVPVIGAIAQTGLVEPTDSSALTATVAVTFLDVDRNDVGHDAAVTAAAASGQIAGLALSEADLIALVMPGAVTKLADSTFGSLDLVFSAASTAFDYLATGEVVTLTYTLAIDDGDGGVGQQTFVVTIAGTNDAPVIDAIAQTDLHEQTDGSVLTTTIAVTFTDVDLGDIDHMAVVTAVTASGETGSLALGEAELIALIIPGMVTKAAGSSDGSVDLAFSAAASAFDYLSPGETVVLTYTLAFDDGDGGVAQQTFVVTITGTNDAPVIGTGDDSATLVELTGQTGSTAELTDNGALAFADGDASDTHAVTSALSNAVWSRGPDAPAATLTAIQGALTALVGGAATGGATGTIDWNFALEDRFVDFLAAGETLTLTYTITVTDDSGAANNRTSRDVTITITGTNDRPVAANDSYTTDEDVALVIPTPGVLGNDADADGDPLSAILIQPPAHGTLTLNPDGSFTYTPDADYHGPDFFTYRADDGSVDGDIATVDITVNPVNDAPVAVDDTVNAVEDTPLTIPGATLTGNDSDIDLDTLTVTSVSNAAGGTVDFNGGNPVFTPDENFSGIAGFDYTIADGNGGIATGHVTIDVAPVADAPVLEIATGNGTPVAIGGEFRVNTFTIGSQAAGSLAALADGGFVVTWTSAGAQDGDSSGIFGQMFDAGGNPAGAEFQINTQFFNPQIDSSVVGLESGGFVVTWTSFEQDATDSGFGDEAGIFGQMFDAGGNPAGAEFQVNTHTAFDQSTASVAALADGGFVVTWGSLFQDSAGTGIYGQRFGADGGPAGAEFQISSDLVFDQLLPAVAALENGGFVVTWSSEGQDGSGTGIYGRLFDADGDPAGAEFQVNSHTALGQVFSSVAVLGDGGFVITWSSNGQDGSGFGIYGQRFDVAGNPAGAEFAVNTHTAGNQNHSRVAALADGGFIVTWTSNGQDGSLNGIYGQRFDADGNRDGAEFRLSETTVGNQAADGAYGVTTTAQLADGTIATVWRGDPSISNSEIYARLFALPTSIAGAEDTAIPLLAITAAVTDTDGSETLELLLSGYPAGATFSLGQPGAVAGTWVIDDAGDIASLAATPLTVTPPENYTGSFTLSVTANVTDQAILSGGAASDTASVSRTMEVTVNPASEAPLITGGDVTGSVTEDLSHTAPLGELVVNGGFESSFTGWTNTGGFRIGEPNTGFNSAASYQVAAQLGQSLSTVAGVTYRLSFFASNPFGSSSEVNSLAVTWNGGTVLALDNVPPSGGYQNFTQYSVDVLASGTATELEITLFDSEGYWVLDDVSVVALPGTERATGTIAFTDTDLSDTHMVSATENGGGYFGTFAASITDPATGDGSGTVTWTFTVDDADIQHLAEGETLVQTYTVTIDDGAGGTVSQVVTVTVNGANEPPVAVDDVIIVDRATGTPPATAASTPVVDETTADNNSQSNAQAIDRTALRIAPNGDLGDDSLPSLTIEGSINPGSDRDYYSIVLRAGETLILDIDNTSGSLDTILRLYNSAEAQLASNDDSPAHVGGGGSQGDPYDSHLTYVAIEDGTYSFRVESYAGTSSGSYDLQVSIADFQWVDGGPTTFSTHLLLANDFDVEDGNALTVVAVAGNGVSLSPGGDTITAQAGVTAFQYTVEDSHGAQSTATVTVNSVPLAVPSGILIGGDGDDILIGGMGDNTLTGGAGADVFVIDPSAFTGDARDFITDYDFGEGDRIDLTALLDGIADTAAEVDSVLRLSDDAGDTSVLFNDGGGDIIVATLAGNIAQVQILFNDMSGMPAQVEIA